MNTQELLDAIKQRAEDALSTGKAWALTDRIAYIEEALQAIVKLCEKAGGK